MIDSPGEVLRRFSKDSRLGELLRAGENEVFRVEIKGKDAILRLTPCGHRTRSELCAELDFVRYLVKNEYPASSPIAAEAGEFVAEAGNGRHACCFEFVPGTNVVAFGDDWDEHLFRKWGRNIARLHTLSAQYRTTAPAMHSAQDDDLFLTQTRRFAWDEEITARWMLQSLSGRATTAYERLAPLLKAAESKECIVVHGDFGIANFHLYEGEIYVYDFDDCMIHHPSYDVAVAVWPLRGQEPDARDRYLRWIVAGYEEVRTLDKVPLQAMFDWRTLYMFAHHIRKWGNQIPEDKRSWIARLEQQIETPVQWGIPD